MSSLLWLVLQRPSFHQYPQAFVRYMAIECISSLYRIHSYTYRNLLVCAYKILIPIAEMLFKTLYWFKDPVSPCLFLCHLYITKLFHLCWSGSLKMANRSRACFMFYLLFRPLLHPFLSNFQWLFYELDSCRVGMGQILYEPSVSAKPALFPRLTKLLRLS